MMIAHTRHGILAFGANSCGAGEEAKRNAVGISGSCWIRNVGKGEDWWLFYLCLWWVWLIN